MSYQTYRQHIIDSLLRRYKAFSMMDLSDNLVKSSVHQFTADFLYDMVKRLLIHDYTVNVKTLNFMKPWEGYSVDIQIWPDKVSPFDHIVLQIAPRSTKDVSEDDPTTAYDRAMKIL